MSGWEPLYPLSPDFIPPYTFFIVTVLAILHCIKLSVRIYFTNISPCSGQDLFAVSFASLHSVEGKASSSPQDGPRVTEGGLQNFLRAQSDVVLGSQEYGVNPSPGCPIFIWFLALLIRTSKELGESSRGA